jgi:DNA topoisomerase II
VFFQGLITNTKQEVREYFEDLDKHIKHFVWEDKLDGISIDMAFSKIAEERKAWICNFQV